jgi:uncharacterized membrane protein
MTLFDTLILTSAIGAGVIGGTFFAYSASVMTALGRLPAPQGIAAMQSIDVVIINAWFMTPFLGTALVGVAVAVMAVARWSDAGSLVLLAGAVLYVVGTLLVTMLINVPMNNALAAATPTTTEAAHLWARYLVSWTFWNHVRTVAALAAMIAFVMAFRLRA